MKKASPALILASTSAARRRLLADAGVSVHVESPDVDELTLKRELRKSGAWTGPGTARALARAKSVSVSRRFPEALVIGADQVLVHGERLFDKPGTRQEARRQLMALRGATHFLDTAVAVAEAGRVVWRKSVRASLSMRRFSPAFLDSYLEAEGEEVLRTVGGYRLEGSGAQLFSSVKGDFFGILGLPLIPLLEYLRSRKALPV